MYLSVLLLHNFVTLSFLFFFFFNDTATTEIYTLSLHDALPISVCRAPYQGGTQSSVSSGAWSSRERFTYGSKIHVSTNFAPARYASSAIARTSSSCSGSPATSTTCPGWTFVPKRTVSSARRSARVDTAGDRTTIANRSPLASSTPIERFLASPSLADATRRSYRVDVEQFARWLESRRIPLEEVGVRELTEYATELGRGRPKLAPATIARKLAAVRSLLRFLYGAARVPDAALSPRRVRRLPDPPRPEHVNATLDAFAGDEPLALRNRALVELVYSAGLRSAEAVSLELADVDFEQELVR